MPNFGHFRHFSALPTHPPYGGGMQQLIKRKKKII
jgi:hypothetical protein